MTEKEQDILSQIDIQAVLGAGLKRAIDDYFYGLSRHKGWEDDLGDKPILTPNQRKIKRNLNDFRSARFFIFDEKGLQRLLDMAGNDYPVVNLSELRRCCSDIDYLKRAYPVNPYLRHQTTVQPTQDDDVYDIPQDTFSEWLKEQSRTIRILFPHAYK